MSLRYPVLTLHRADLVAAGARSEWLATFDDTCRLRGDDAAPWVRRGGVSRRDPTRLQIELTPLAQVWIARDGGVVLAWLRERGMIGPAALRGADLRGADLRGADLTWADLRGADLRGAYLSGAYLRGADLRGADLRGADLSGTYLIGADLRGADLRGADLRGADLAWAARYSDDPPIAGWTLRDGRLVREVSP